MNTTESNLLIADFMGLSKNLHMRECPITGEYINDDELSYNTSFDWLMLVVEKIESLGYKMGIERNYCFVGEIDKVPIIESTGGNDWLDTLYHTIVLFIEWYNENQKEQEYFNSQPHGY